MDDNFFTEKELKSANRGSIAPVVVVIFVIIKEDIKRRGRSRK